MALYQDKLVSEIQKECKKGQSVENFINNWFRSGENFGALYQFLLAKGVQTNKNSVYQTFRPMLTIRYLYKDQFFYKWNSIAKTKGFANAKQMILTWKELKYSNTQMAEELGLFASNLGPVIDAILEDGDTFKKPRNFKIPKTRNRDGFSAKDHIKLWDDKLKNMGYENLRQAIDDMKSRGFNFSEMAKEFGISPRNFRWRRKRIKEKDEDALYAAKRAKRSSLKSETSIKSAT